MSEKIGYIYCFSNESMPSILKVGMTERKPEERLRDANRSNTWSPPTPYKMEIAKQVYYPKQKEFSIHKLLDLYGKRINPKREFFKSTIDEIKTIFDIIDGEYYFAKDLEIEDEIIDKDDENIDENVEKESIIDKDETDEIESINENINGNNDKKKVKQLFTEGQRIKHTVFDTGNIWISTFQSGKLNYNGKIFKNIYDFVKEHYKVEKIAKFNKNNVFNETECEINNEWVVVSIIAKK